MLILCQCRTTSKYKVGRRITNRNWSDPPNFKGGLWGLPQGNGWWGVWGYSKFDWLVVEANDEDVAESPSGFCKFRTGVVLYRGDKEGLHQFAPVMPTESLSAYRWAELIGDREIMRDRITDSCSAYLWAKNFGDREIMRDRVIESHWALEWARTIGDIEIMRDRIIDSKDAFFWALEIGDREIMRDRITDSCSAYWWAKDIGDIEIMRDRVTESHLALEWVQTIGDIEIMRDRIVDPYDIKRLADLTSSL